MLGLAWGPPVVRGPQTLRTAELSDKC